MNIFRKLLTRKAMTVCLSAAFLLLLPSLPAMAKKAKSESSVSKSAPATTWSEKGLTAISKAQSQEDGTLWVPSGTVLTDDLISFGKSVNIEGAVKGDVVVFGGSLNLNGQVRNDVVVFGGTAEVSGFVGNDMVVIGGSVEFKKGSVVGNDFVVLGGSVETAAKVGNDMVVTGGSVEFKKGAEVGNDAVVLAGNVKNSEHATIRGEFVDALDMANLNIDIDLSGLENLPQVFKSLEGLGESLGSLGEAFESLEILEALEALEALDGADIRVDIRKNQNNSNVY